VAEGVHEAIVLNQNRVRPRAKARR
jgi:hypothetical protein